jgi:adenine-specific DNA methylase
VTDPPYYDAIAYADLSDFFYIWLKRTIGELYPYNFATPQTTKSEECTALKHHHNGDYDTAKQHFESLLLKIFDVIEKQTSGVISIMFAHQSTKAWTTLCNSILGAGMNITGSWAIDTERSAAGVKVNKAFLSSSVTVSCSPSKKSGIEYFKKVRQEVEEGVKKEVDYLYRLGFRGSDLLTACFGQAVSIFGKYERVEKADGTEVTVAELLELARDSAFNALVKGFQGDDYTKFYIGWLQLNGFTEADHDDVMRISQIGLNVDVNNLVLEKILKRNGNKESLATFSERIQTGQRLLADEFLINQVHNAMALFQSGNRFELLSYINQFSASPESMFWRVLTSLCELLPPGTDDHKQANGLLANKESLLRESRQAQEKEKSQTSLEF